MEIKTEPKELSTRTKSGLKWNTSLKIVSQILRFVIGIFLARILDPIDFGIMAIGHMVIHYTNSLSDFGFINALVQKKNLQPVHINSVFTLNLVISLLLCIIIVVSSKYIGLFFNSPESGRVLLFMSSLFILRTFRDIYMALLRRHVLFKNVATIVLLENSVMSFIALGLALLGFRYWSLVWATILSTFIAGFLFASQTKEKIRIQYSHKAMREIYSFGLWNFLRAQLFFINQFITQLIVGKLFGPIALGYFEKSHQLASTPRESIAAQINAVMFSSFSRLQTNTKKQKQWFLKIVLMETILVLPILTGIIAIAEQFIIVVLGEKWVPSILPLQILSVGIIFQIFNGLVAALNVGIGQYKSQTFRELPGTIFFIALCLPLAQWGINGIAVCYTVSMIFISVITFCLSKKNLRLNFTELIEPIWPYLVVNLLMMIVVRWLYHSFFTSHSVMNLVLLAGSGVFLYVGATLLANISLKKDPFFPIRDN